MIWVSLDPLILSLDLLKPYFRPILGHLTIWNVPKGNARRWLLVTLCERVLTVSLAGSTCLSPFSRYIAPLWAIWSLSALVLDLI